MKEADSSYQVEQLLERLNEEAETINILENRICQIKDEVSNLDRRRNSTLQTLSNILSKMRFRWYGSWLPLSGDLSVKFISSARDVASRKRQLDQLWTEYKNAVEQHVSTRGMILAASNDTNSRVVLSSLSSSLQASLYRRDALFMQHEKLVSAFLLSKRQFEDVQRSMGDDAFHELTPWIDEVVHVDKLIDESLDVVDQTQNMLEDSKRTYQGILLRLEEVSSSLHESRNN